MAQTLGTLDDWIRALLRIDSTVPGTTAQQRYDVVNDVYANYHAALGVRAAIIGGPGASVSTSLWQFSGAAATNDPIAIDAVEIALGSGGFKPLQLVSEGRVRYLQQTEGRVAASAAEVEMSSAKITHNDAGTYFLTGYFYPLRSSTIRIQGRFALTVLAAVGDVLVCTPQAWYLIGRIAAVVIGAMMKRPQWLLKRIAEPIPMQMRLAFDLNRLMFHEARATSRELMMGVMPSREPLPIPELSKVGDEPA